MAEHETSTKRALPETRKGQGPEQLERAEFERRMRRHFADPVFERDEEALARLVADAWDGYANARKSPRTRKAGPRFADPDYDLSTDWLEAATRSRRPRSSMPTRRDRDGSS